MDIPEPILFASANGAEIRIRTAARKDASPLIDFMAAILGESEHLIHLPHEYGVEKGQMRRIIKRRGLRPDELMLVAELDGQIIAKLDAETDSRYRLCHSIEIGLFVRAAFRGEGVGKAMLSTFMDWAKKSGVLRRVELHVHEKNQAALALYNSFGFELEGRRKAALREDDNHFSDDLIMAKSFTNADRGEGN